MKTSFMKKSLIFIVTLMVAGFMNAQKVRVAAAANLHYALEQIKKQYEHEHPNTTVEITY